MTDNKDVVTHYEAVEEENRLAAGIGALERVRTEQLLNRYLPPPPARILDVGGAAGVYAVGLAEAGYEIDLIDPVSRHVELARARLGAVPGNRGRAHLGDARRLDFPDQVADAVLFLGPLYHLPERDDRMSSLREAGRVLRPGGLLMAAAISRFASVMDGFSRRLIRDDRFVEIMDRDLAEGRHTNPTDDPTYFTTAYLHLPAELREELTESGFAVEELVAVEGPFWCMPDAAELWNEPSSRSLMLRLLDRLGSEESLLGASAHLLAAARKPG